MATAVAMMSDAKAVRFVAQVLHHTQRLAILVDIERNAVAGEIDFLEPFGYAHKRHTPAYAHGIESLNGSAQLTLAAVDNHQLRQLLSFLHQAGVTTRENLLHRSEIVGSFHRLDVEMAIVLFRRFGIAKHHARSNRIGALYVRVIETLHVSRQLLQTEIALHGGERAHHSLVGVELLHTFEFIHLELLGVLQRQLEQLALVATLRNHKMHVLELGIGNHRHKHVFQLQGKAFAQLVDGYRHQFLVGFIEPSLIFQRKRLNNRAIAHMHEIHISRIVVAQQTEHVDVVQLLIHHLALGTVFFDEQILFFESLRLLETQFASQASHLSHEMFGELARVAIENLLDSFDIFGITLHRHQPAATALAIVNVILQTQRRFST